ncbi:hypothetical protein HN51_038982 [Arachis hypogaea]
MEEARQRQSSILLESERPAVYSRVTSCALDHDAECVTEILVRGICRIPNLRIWEKPLQQIYVDLILSEYNSSRLSMMESWWLTHGTCLLLQQIRQSSHLRCLLRRFHILLHSFL